MKSVKTKKFLGGVAIAAVSLGCLGLAGIANANPATPANAGTPTNNQGSGAYQLGTLQGAMTGDTTITANISTAQTTAGQTLTGHTLEYIQIGSYITHGSSGPFTLSATNQTMEDAFYQFLTANASGLKQAFPNASYTTADGEALNWLMTGNSSGTFLGADASGQNGYGVSENADYAVRLLANYLYANIPTSDLKTTTWNSGATDQTGSFNLPNPGVYLIIDTTINASLPIILSTKPSTGYAVPTGMENYVTDQIALKDQDPQAAPVKQFVTDPTTNSSGDLTGGKLTGTMSATIGSQNVVTYQVSNVFPKTNGYLQYTYKFIDNPGTGMTLNIQNGDNMYVAGIPLTTLANDRYATVTEVTSSATGGNWIPDTITNYGGTGNANISEMPSLVGGPGAQLIVSLNEAGMQYIAAHGYQTSNVNGNKINFGKLSSQSDVSHTVNGSTNTMSGVNNGASSYTGQTQAATNGENGNQTSAAYPQAGGELFGLTYQAYLNQNVAYDNTSMTTEASNTAMTDNNGTKSSTSTDTPLKTSGEYNGGIRNQMGNTAPTNQTNPGNITGTDNNGKTGGVPNKTAVGAGLNWMKIWGSGAVAKGASFYVKNDAGQYLYATGNGWAWSNQKVKAQKFEASTLYTGTGNMTVNPEAEGGLFEINGLADGTYTVTEAHAATGADPNVLPSFTITLQSGKPEEVKTTSESLNLVNSTPNGNPFNSTTFNTVENVRSLTGLPLTGGAGILTGVIAAVILFGTAGIVLVAYKRRKQQED